jgi:hypothetical protein
LTERRIISMPDPPELAALSNLDRIRVDLPLRVDNAAVVSAVVLSIHGVHNPRMAPPSWGVNINSCWAIKRGQETVLSQGDEVENTLEEPLPFLVGLDLTDVEGTDPDGEDIVFVFGGGEYRVEVYPDDESEEWYIYDGLGWWFYYPF